MFLSPLSVMFSLFGSFKVDNFRPDTREAKEHVDLQLSPLSHIVSKAV